MLIWDKQLGLKTLYTITTIRIYQSFLGKRVALMISIVYRIVASNQRLPLRRMVLSDFHYAPTK